MLVVPDQKALVLAPSNPEQVTACIPTAKTFQFKGHNLLAVPHRIDEARVLRNLGMPAPSPILFHYAWEGLHKPFDAQRETAGFATLYTRAYILNEIGTGKSLATLWAIDYLKRQGKLRKVLVIAPLSTITMTWGDEIALNFPELRYVVVYGDSKRRKKLLAQDADIYVINHDGVEIVLNELMAMPDLDLVVIDELTQAARNSSTRRWKALNKLINTEGRFKPAWGLTGKPQPKSPMDVWAQVRLLTKDRVPAYRNRWRDMTMRQVTQFKWVPRPEAVEICSRAMQPAIRFRRDECFDMPDCTYTHREVGMTPEQTKLYREMKERLRAQAEDGEILAVNEGVKMGKLVQIACGVVYDTQGNEITLGAPGRMSVVQEIIEQSEGKVIIFVPYVSTVHYVADTLRAAGYGVGVVYGDVSKAKRDEVFSAFKNDDTMDVLVAQPAAMSHGLTLVVANTIVWYAPITSNDIFEQANGRVTRPGQERQQFVVMLSGSAVERKMYQALETQGNMQDILLDEIKGKDLLTV